MKITRARRALGAAVVAAAWGMVHVAAASVVQFDIDSATSVLHMTGTYNTDIGVFPLQEPIAGTMTTHIDGVLMLEVGTTPYGFRGGDIFALVNPIIPQASQPANFSFQSSVQPQGIVNGLVRNFVFRIDGEPTPLSNGFEMSSTQIQATNGQIISDVLPTVDLTGQMATGISGSASVFAPLGEHMPLRKLQIPFTMTFEVEVPRTEYIMNLAFSGTIFASGEVPVVPEPASGLALLAGAVVAIGRRRSR